MGIIPVGHYHMEEIYRNILFYILKSIVIFFACSLTKRRLQVFHLFMLLSLHVILANSKTLSCPICAMRRTNSSALPSLICLSERGPRLIRPANSHRWYKSIFPQSLTMYADCLITFMTLPPYL